MTGRPQDFRSIPLAPRQPQLRAPLFPGPGMVAVKAIIDRQYARVMGQARR